MNRFIHRVVLFLFVTAVVIYLLTPCLVKAFDCGCGKGKFMCYCCMDSDSYNSGFSFSKCRKKIGGESLDHSLEAVPCSCGAIKTSFAIDKDMPDHELTQSIYESHLIKPPPIA